jgi:hypothetical protein
MFMGMVPMGALPEAGLANGQDAPINGRSGSDCGDGQRSPVLLAPSEDANECRSAYRSSSKGCSDPQYKTTA